MSSKSTDELMDQYVMPNYGRFPYGFVKGEGSWLEDEEGERYLDLASGIAVCSLGHCHPVMQEALKEQVGRLIHCSNLYKIREQALLAEHMAEMVMERPGKVFFCNSGAEANDSLIKLARKFGNEKAGPGGRFEVITCKGSFHGRTLGGIAATGQDKVKTGFEPLLEGFVHVPFNDVDALRKAVGNKTAAILIEVIQGEGGIHAASEEFLRTAQQLRDEHNLLLMFDEVQCGLGRTGSKRTWDEVAADIEPDAVSWAKGLAGGFPMGAIWVSRSRDVQGPDGSSCQLCDVLGPGSHGSTFGGTPLGAAVALAVQQYIEKEKLWEKAAEMGAYIQEQVEAWKHPLVRETRGRGLMLGFVIDVEELENCQPYSESGQAASLFVVNRLMEEKLLTVPAESDVVRWLPALTVSREDVDEGLSRMKGVLDALHKQE